MVGEYSLVERFGVNLVGKVNVERWAVWCIVWWKEENGTYGDLGFFPFFFIKYVYEVLGGLCEWVEMWKNVFAFMPTFWEDFRFFI